MVTGDGYAKVLDFGLAKLTEPLGDGTLAPTAIADETAEGAVLGTVGYMSPEQVQGREVDHRTDVFSLVCVLYEAMTRQRPFGGETAVDTMHQILRSEPTPVREINPDTPAAIRRVIRRGLVKDPERRIQSMKDLWLELANLVEEWDELGVGSSSSTFSAIGGVAPLTAPAKSRKWFWVGGAVTVAVLAMMLLWRPWSASESPSGSPSPGVSFTQLTSQGGVEQMATLSPDGRFIAYEREVEGSLDIFLQRVGGQNPLNLTAGSDSDDYQPAFSPDGEQIAFGSDREGGGLFLMGATGESVRGLTDRGSNPSWSPDGRRIVYATESLFEPLNRNAHSELWVVDVESGKTERIFTGDAVQPSWSPQGGRIAYWTVRYGGQRDIATVSIEGGEVGWVTESTSVDWNPVWGPAGETLYFSSDRGGSFNIWVVDIDPVSGEVLGQPRPLSAPSRNAGQISISADGRQIAYSDINDSSNLEWVGLDPETLATTGDVIELTAGTNAFVRPEPSPDGRRVAFSSMGRQEDLFLINVDGSDLRQITDDPFKDRSPYWSPDGERILFHSDRSGKYEFWSIRPDGRGLEQLATGDESLSMNPRLSLDQSQLVVSGPTGSRIFDLTGSLPATSFEELPPVDDLGRVLFDPHWSPDGKYLIGHVWDVDQQQSRGLAIYSVESRNYEVVFDEDLPGYSSVRWPAGDRRVLVKGETDRDGTVILAIDLDSREVTEVWKAPRGLRYMSVSSDGRAIHYMRIRRESDIWLATLEDKKDR